MQEFKAPGFGKHLRLLYLETGRTQRAVLPPMGAMSAKSFKKEVAAIPSILILTGIASSSSFESSPLQG